MLAKTKRTLTTSTCDVAPQVRDETSPKIRRRRRPRPLVELDSTLLLTMNEAAQLLACSRSTLYNLIHEKKVVGVKLLGGVRITAESVRKLVAELIAEQA